MAALLDIQLRYVPWTDRAVQGRPARPLGPLVKDLENGIEKKPMEREWNGKRRLIIFWEENM